MPEKAVLFVCTGNICRSPAAEALFRHHLAHAGSAGRIRHDSAGVASYHIGEAPDPRSQKALRAVGADMADLRARAVEPADFYDFDLILAMDQSHYTALKRQAPADATAEIALFLDYAHDRTTQQEVPDPYYGEAALFTEVTALMDEAAQALVRKLLR